MPNFLFATTTTPRKRWLSASSPPPIRSSPQGRIRPREAAPEPWRLRWRLRGTPRRSGAGTVQEAQRYLSGVEDTWGEICGSREFASLWADKLLGLIRNAWSDTRKWSYVRGTCLCLSALVAADRLQDLFDLLALQQPPFWPYCRFAVQALLHWVSGAWA